MTGFWCPNTDWLFSDIDDGLERYEFDDTRYLMHDHRVMITTNTIDPKCYKVTKINEMDPQGLIKLTVKQDEFDTKRDNPELLLCDYYTASGSSSGEYINEDAEQPEEKTSVITWLKRNDDGSYEEISDEHDKHLTIKEKSYFSVEFSDEDVVPFWNVYYSENNMDYEDVKEKAKKMYCNLINIEKIDDTKICIRPSNASFIRNKLFVLEVYDENGQYKSKLEMEVME